MAVKRFIVLVTSLEDELTALGMAYDRAVEANHRGSTKGKNYRVFGERERMVNRLCKLAGIKDS